MVSGAAGQNGPPAPEHVALVRRNVPEHVRTHDQQMEAKTVPELQMKLENAAIEFVQVSHSLWVRFGQNNTFTELKTNEPNITVITMRKIITWWEEMMKLLQRVFIFA